MCVGTVIVTVHGFASTRSQGIWLSQLAMQHDALRRQAQAIQRGSNVSMESIIQRTRDPGERIHAPRTM